MDSLSVKFLNNIGLVFEDTAGLDGQLISRDMLLNTEKYNSIKDTIPEFKKLFSSSTLTALHKNAEEAQKWPLINITRQILKQNNFKMVPIRKSDGLTPDKKKKYKRYFQIHKLKAIGEQQISEE
jgi:hypothetical protein